MRNIEERFERFAAKLAVPESLQKECRIKVKALYEQMNRISFDSFQKYRLGGSFDRHTYIKGNFDVDCYFIFDDLLIYRILFSFIPNFYSNPINIPEMLFSELYYNLKLIQNWSGISIIRDPPYLHAIPIRISRDIKVDCIPALQPNSSSSILLIPEGNELKKVDPTLDEEALSEVNTFNNGRVTPLVRVLKYWNYLSGKKLKSYFIERLVIEVFEEVRFKNWVKAIRHFFQNACRIIDNKERNPDRVNPKISIFDELSKAKLGRIYNIFAFAAGAANCGKWEKLFGDEF